MCGTQACGRARVVGHHDGVAGVSLPGLGQLRTNPTLARQLTRSSLLNGLGRTAEKSVPCSVMLWSKEVAAMTEVRMHPKPLQSNYTYWAYFDWDSW